MYVAIYLSEPEFRKYLAHQPYEAYLAHQEGIVIQVLVPREQIKDFRRRGPLGIGPLMVEMDGDDET